MMIEKYFINVAVQDSKKSKVFFEGLGFNHVPKFTNDVAVAIKLSDTLFLMCLETRFFETFTPKTKLDVIPHRLSQLNSFNLSSKAEVDEMYEKAMKLGAKELRPTEIYEDKMYGRSFIDLDGYGWEIGWMDESKF